MLATPFEITRLVRLVQKENALMPMLVIVPGMVTLVKLPQRENAKVPMLETQLERVTLVMPMHP